LGQAQMPTTANKPQISARSAEDEKARSTELNQQLLSAALLHSYAASVNNLLSELAGRLEVISQHAAAGEVSQQNAMFLKLAATRATIARLQTISAVYDFQLVSRDDDDLDSSDCGLTTLRAKSTVTVEELQREAGK
ncbi:MAG TPA: hypothetical protein VM912_10060, partial [Terriglobales bacterium]|nr:hypothetical protein [Terriglobales bacterium]